jgi:hypothetical protein
MRYTQDRNWGCRLTEYTFRGLRTVVLENELLRVVVLADKGTDIYEFLYKPLDLDFMWRSPIPLRNPSLFVPTVANAAGAFHDNYHGGWQEILPTGGIPSNYKGAEFGYHGEVSLIPWDYAITEDHPERIAVTFKVRTYRSPYYIEKHLSLVSGRAVLFCEETLVNEGEEEMELMWGHHPALGENFVDPSCRIDLPAARVLTQNLGETSRLIDGEGYTWPHVPSVNNDMVDLSRVPPRDIMSHDVAFLYDLEATWFAIRSQQKQVGFGMWWSPEVLRYLWFWQVYGGAFGYNLYGRSYHLALEPWSSIPSSFELAQKRSTTLHIGPHETLNLKLAAVVFEGDGRVCEIDGQGVLKRSSSET